MVSLNDQPGCWNARTGPTSFAVLHHRVKPTRPCDGLRARRIHKKAGALADAGGMAPDGENQKVYFRVSMADQRETTRVGLLPASCCCSGLAW